MPRDPACIEPFPQHLTRCLIDDEVEGVVRPLRDAVAQIGGVLRMAPECIAAEIGLRACQFLQDRERERRARHPSKIERDLGKGLGRVRRCLEDLQTLGPSPRRRGLVRAAGRVDRLLRWLNGFDQDLRDALFIEAFFIDAGDLAEDPNIGPAISALQGLADPRALAAADPARLARAAAALTELSEAIEAAAYMIDGRRLGKTSRRQSEARERLLDRLTDLFQAVTGCRPTCIWDPDAGETASPFAQFALTVLWIVDPETPERQRGAESDIQAAVRRKRRRHRVEVLTARDKKFLISLTGRCHRDDELTEYWGPCDRKRSRGRFSAG